MRSVKGLICGLFCDDKGKPSLTDVLVGLSFLLFAGASLWLLVRGGEWRHYDSFAAYAFGGGSLLKGTKYLANTYMGATGARGAPGSRSCPPPEAGRKGDDEI